MLRLTELKLPLDHAKDALRPAICQRLGITDAPAPGNGRAPAAKATAPAKPASR